jgi:hypothetical protein
LCIAADHRQRVRRRGSRGGGAVAPTASLVDAVDSDVRAKTGINELKKLDICGQPIPAVEWGLTPASATRLTHENGPLFPPSLSPGQPMRMTTTPMTACLCVAALFSVRAQVEGAPRRNGELAVYAGIAQGEQLNATASPLTFRGRGFDGAVDYRRALRGERFVFAISANGGMRSVTTIDGSGSSAAAAGSERITDGRITASLLRRFGGDSTGRGFAAGVAVATDLAVTAHRYADPTRHVSDFLAGFAMIGPSVSWRQPIGGGAARAQISVPLVALADHPYSDLRSDYSPTSVRFAGPGTLRGLSGAVTYAPADRRRAGVVTAYRFSLLDYADVQPLRAVSQSLSVGVVVRFGGASR